MSRPRRTATWCSRGSAGRSRTRRSSRRGGRCRSSSSSGRDPPARCSRTATRRCRPSIARPRAVRPRGSRGRPGNDHREREASLLWRTGAELSRLVPVADRPVRLEQVDERRRGVHPPLRLRSTAPSQPRAASCSSMHQLLATERPSVAGARARRATPGACAATPRTPPRRRPRADRRAAVSPVNSRPSAASHKAIDPAVCPGRGGLSKTRSPRSTTSPSTRIQVGSAGCVRQPSRSNPSLGSAVTTHSGGS